MITKIQSESLNLADDFAFTGTITGAGESNAPSFSTSITSNQNITNAADVKVAFATEQYDTGSDFDTTNYKFVVPSAGKYFFSTMVVAQAEGTVLSNAYVKFKINGSNKQVPFWYGGGPSTNIFSSIKYLPMSLTCCYNLSASDYVEVFVYLAHSAGSGTHVVFGTETYSHFSGFKISS